MKKFWSKLKTGAVFFSELFTNNPVTRNVQQAIPFWFASLVAGLIAVGYAWLFHYAESIIHRVVEWEAWAVFVVIPLSFLFAWFVVHLFAPNARGSGIPQVMAAIELATPKHENKLNLLLSIRILITKIVSSIAMVAGGGAVGREGPTIQIAGSIFVVIHRWIPKSWPKLSNQAFILTGAAAGLAAAFNTPLGGVVFAMEELARIHIRFFRTALFAAVIIAGLTAQGLLGSYLYLGYPNVANLEFSIFFSVAIAAIIAGLLGGYMCKLILAIMKWRKRLTTWQSVFYVLATGLIVASVAFYLSEAILGSGKETMNSLLFTNRKDVDTETVLFRILGPVLCFNTGAAGGIFAPSLAAGASVGAYVASLFDYVGSNANILILSGMVGFLTGVTRTPFTSAILVLEMTDRHSVIFHLLLAAMVSNLVAYFTDKRSFYERLKEGYIDDIIHPEDKKDLIATEGAAK